MISPRLLWVTQRARRDKWIGITAYGTESNDKEDLKNILGKLTGCLKNFSTN